MELLICIRYLARLGFLSFIFGRILPRRIFSGYRFPFRPFKREKNGLIYERLKVRKWKDKVPDMSKLFPSFMLKKSIDRDFSKKLPALISETCIAEFVHANLAVLGFKCMELWEGFGGFTVSVLYFFGNLAFVVIQRYNRPRLVSLYEKVNCRQSKEEELCESSETALHR